MRYVIENDELRVEVDSFGAELKSVKNKVTGQEYMWYGDPEFWGRTSPILFPFVGSLKNKEFIYKGKHYPMGQHGFARDHEHTLVSQTDDELLFSFSSDEETLEKYPFAFTLRIGYKLEGDTLRVSWEVENPADETMYFSIGAHPAFNCPVHEESSKAGYRLYFGGVDEIHHHGNTRDTGLATMDEDLVIPLTDHEVVITDDFFDRCTIMVEGKQTGEVGLSDPEGNRIVTMDFDTPLFAVWSPEEKNAPFLCIEPWYGRCDSTDFDGTLEERDYTNVLGPHETFDASYTIKFG